MILSYSFWTQSYSILASEDWKRNPILHNPQPAWTPSLNFESIEKRLHDENIVLLIPMRDYLEYLGKKADFENKVYLAVLESGLKAVFKPDLEAHDMYAEVAAYKASQWMKSRLVPPTVIKQFKKQKGSLQFFVETPLDTVTLEDQTILLNSLNDLSRQEIEVFCFLFGQWDRSPSNILFVPYKASYLAALIDNSGLLQQQHVILGKSPFIRKAYCDYRHDTWDNRFPFEKAQKISLNDIDHHPDFKSCGLTSQKFSFLKGSKKPLIYIFWRNSLWFQPYAETPFLLKNLSPSLLAKIKKLDEKTLKAIWKMSPKEWTPRQRDEIIRLTLDRKNQLLNSLNTESSQ
ncbi:MAG: hypothetical protein JSS34_04825 [Proteobacteria bacterium]|nr:hypothetical protein [Pseudomonadota bacterium]